ncbi:hypothetical protein [Desulfonatronum thiosulfatophilum]|uniref:hypothetical protein n=1 Tax=Desulfonatronum thiosulfatophilum TaxID=617002 RepID=UPI0011135EE0|nr:hypothetical protein [Desulfonatronum thiosulfatophilum]
MNILNQAIKYNINDEKQRKLSTKILEKFFIDINRILNPKVYFEIGAHQATFSKIISEIQPEGKIFAFEANPYPELIDSIFTQATRADLRLSFDFASG